LLLDAQVEDDGNPDPPGMVTVAWSQTAGPGTAVFDDEAAVDTGVTADLPGTYILRLTADDGDVKTFDEVTLEVTASGPAVLLAATDGGTGVVEGGAGDTYTVVLSEAPTHDVTLTVSPDTQLQATPGTLVFSPTDWDAPQTVTVSAVDDDADEGEHTGFISHTTSSADPDYDNLVTADLLVSITDNDLNLPPSVVLGLPDDVAIPADVGLWLEATVTDDSKPQPANLNSTWSLVSAPAGGTATFDDSTAVETGVIFDVAGEYVLRLTADDGAATHSAELTVHAVAGSGAMLTGEDIGDVSAPGSHAESNGVWTVQGAGSDIWNNSDEFYFLSAPFTGDAQLTVRVTSQVRTHSWAKAGVMIRDEKTNDSAHAMLVVTPGNGLSMQNRPLAGVDSLSSSQGSYTFPVWLRVIRTGDEISFFQSGDAVTWTAAGSLTLAMTGTDYIGLAVTSHEAGTLGQVVFDHLSSDALGHPNLGPVVDAGTDASADAGTAYALAGSASDDGNPVVPGAVTTQWTRRSGPGAVSFSDAGSLTSEVTFDAPGTQVLRLLADDGDVTTFDEVVLEVQGSQAATVTLSDLVHIYDGTPKAATVTTEPEGLAVSITYDGSSQAPVASGEHAVLATVTEPGYTGQASGTLVIGYGLSELYMTGDGSTASLQIITESRLQFLLQWTNNLSADPVQWNDVGDWRPGTGGTLEWNDALGTDTFRLYRILYQAE
jgi:hypothetical protein